MSTNKQCQCQTLQGTQCKKKATIGDFCTQHAKKCTKRYGKSKIPFKQKDNVRQQEERLRQQAEKTIRQEKEKLKRQHLQNETI